MDGGRRGSPDSPGATTNHRSADSRWSDPRGTAPVPCLVVHGTDDSVVPVQQSRDFASQLLGCGWPVSSLELETDHAGVIGTEYDPNVGRCFSSREPGAIVAMQAAVRLLSGLWAGN